ncbi:MAG: universal stress protein [Gemmatimonadaceae bacterium]|nr:universal stress protein [Caulobacter sp.]
MPYTTLMVHLELGRSNAGLLNVASDLAERLHAGVIGIAACQPAPIGYGEEYVLSGDLVQAARDELDRELKVAEAEFRGGLKGKVESVEWRSTITFGALSDYVAKEARSADLILTRLSTPDLLDHTRTVNTGGLVMQAGRPVLVAPEAIDTLKLDQILVAWKDTREARRAVVDALPLLQKAAQVMVAEIAAEADQAAAQTHVEQVAAWLQRHGVAAAAMASLAIGDDASRLSQLALEHDADLIVAGAYGHTRLQEWAFGGVTRDLLARKDRCVLLSH